MKRIWMVLAMLLAAPPQSFHQQPDVRKSTAMLGDNKEQASEALKTGTLILSPTKTEYFLAPTKPLWGTQTGLTWSFGNRAPRPEETLSVDVQVGEYKGSPVFLRLAVPKDGGEQVVKDSVKLLSDATGESKKLPGQPEVQSCSGKKVCVKMCPDGKGNKYCCKYECVTQSPAGNLPKN